jgi:hypothetical protein
MASEVLLDIIVSDGKYRIIQTREHGTKAYRYKADAPISHLDPANPWLDVTCTPGSNMILAMAYELKELREKLS